MKNNVIKKFVFPILVILYDIATLFWCSVIASNLVFSLTRISFDGVHVYATLQLNPSVAFSCAYNILFILFSFFAALLLTVKIFKKQTDKKLNILICVFLSLSLIEFLLIPATAYIIAYYVILSSVITNIQNFAFIRPLYIMISFAILVIHVIFSMVKKDKKVNI